MTEKEIIQSIIEDDRGVKQDKSTELDNQERGQPQELQEDCYFKTFKGVRKLLKDDLQSLYEQTYQKALATAPETAEETAEEKARKAAARKMPRSALQIAEFLRQRLHFVRLKNDMEGQREPLYYYNPDRGFYETNEEFIKDLIFVVNPELTERKALDVIYKLSRAAISRKADNRYTALGNLLYNAKTGETEPFSPKKLVIRKIDCNYIADAKEPNIKGWKVTEWLKNLFGGDDELYRMALQIIKASVTGESLKNVFWLLGKGGTGKGTFQELIKNLVGAQNVANLKINEVNKSRFETSVLVGKTVVIGDDVQVRVKIKDVSTFFSLTTGDPIKIEEKGKTPYSVNLKMTIIQSSNGLPIINGDSDAIGRRFRILPFKGGFAGKVNPAIKDDYICRREVLEYLLCLALNTKTDLKLNPQASQKAVYDFQEEVNEVVSFTRNFFKKNLVSSFLPNSFVWWVWLSFKEYYQIENDLTPNALHREIKNNLPDGFKPGKANIPAGQMLPRGFSPKEDLPHYAAKNYSTDRMQGKGIEKRGQEKGYLKNRELEDG